MELFILFQTDVYKTRTSRVCFGVFSSWDLAIEAARKFGLYNNISSVVIEPCTLDKPEQI